MTEMPGVQLLDDQLISILRCPVTGSRLKLVDGFLVAETGGIKYPVRDGLPSLLAEEAVLPPDCPTLDAFRAKFGVGRS